MNDTSSRQLGIFGKGEISAACEFALFGPGGLQALEAAAAPGLDFGWVILAFGNMPRLGLGAVNNPYARWLESELEAYTAQLTEPEPLTRVIDPERHSVAMASKPNLIATRMAVADAMGYRVIVRTTCERAVYVATKDRVQMEIMRGAGPSRISRQARNSVRRMIAVLA